VTAIWHSGRVLRSSWRRREVELERGNLLLGLLVLALAGGAEKVEVFALGLLFADAMALGVLPNFAPLAFDAVCAIIEVLAVHAANGAVKGPVLFVFHFLQLVLAALHLGSDMSLGSSGLIGFDSLLLLFQLLQFLFVEDTLDLSVLEALLACLHSGLASILQLTLSLLLLPCHGKFGKTLLFCRFSFSFLLALLGFAGKSPRTLRAGELLHVL
jgi:hypothetical protein